MGLFSRSQSGKKLNWTELTSIVQLDEIISSSSVALIFKHSTRCAISAMALNSFEQNWPEENETDLYFLDLLKHRDVSNQVAAELGVEHQSPQVILFTGKKVHYNSSHSSIDARKIESELKRIK